MNSMTHFTVLQNGPCHRQAVGARAKVLQRGQHHDAYLAVLPGAQHFLRHSSFITRRMPNNFHQASHGVNLLQQAIPRIAKGAGVSRNRLR